MERKSNSKERWVMDGRCTERATWSGRESVMWVPRGKREKKENCAERKKERRKKEKVFIPHILVGGITI